MSPPAGLVDRLIGWSIRRRFLVISTALFLAAAGALCLWRLPVDAIPDLSENQVIIVADWPGHSAREVEDQVSFPLASRLRGMAQLQTVRSSAEFGFAMINLIFEESAGFYAARDRVLERLESISGLPAGVVPYLAPDATAVGQIFWYTLDGAGHDPGELRALQDSFVRPLLSAIPGVAEVASVGGQVREYQIDADPIRLRAAGATLGQLVAALSRASGAAGGGVVSQGAAEYVVSGITWATSVADLESVVVDARPKGPLLVKNVASVHLGPAPRRSLLEKNGVDAVGGVVLMRKGENPLEITERIRARLPFVDGGLPAGVHLAPFYERTRLISATLGTLRRALLEEIAVCIMVVLLMLGHLRSAMVVVLTLPVAVLGSFLLMAVFGIPSNIMSLAGIAIAIGVLADSAIVMMENAYTRLAEHDAKGGPPGERLAVARRACLVVGRPLFFSVLITVVSFLPVFALSGMEGRLFRPLAFTKTFALLGVALLAITLVPALIPGLVRGKLRSERQSWLVRSVADVYRPVLAFLLDRPRYVAISFALVAAVGVYLFPRLGSEFMPSLDEGAILEMPVTAPGVPIEQVAKSLLARDAILRSLPEVEMVVGKAGRAETATDPAPLEMMETQVALRPRDEWPARALPRSAFVAAARAALPGSAASEVEAVADAAVLRFDGQMRQLARGTGSLEEAADSILRENVREAAAERGLAAAPAAARLRRPYLARKTKAELVHELDGMLQMPGWTNVWTQPIINRVDMQATGIRTMVGVKVLGSDYAALQALSGQIATVLRTVPGAADVFADQAVGQPTLEVKLDRERAARAGVSPAEVEEAVEVALGGKVVGATLEGRRRVPLRVRYASGFRTGQEAAGRVLVGDKNPVPLAQVASLRVVEGPSMIRGENGLLATYVQLNVRGRDLSGFVAEAKTQVAARVQLPAGTSIEWGGQYEHELSARKTLSLVLPLVVLLIFLILYLTWHDSGDALLLLLTVPGALVGGLVFQWLWGFHFSVAVWVGYITCFGLATETGIIMLVYLREAVDRRGGLAAIRSLAELREAVMEGAVQRLRPKLLTESVIVLSLLPMLWATGPGAEILRPMAAPVLGGILIADEIIDLSIPALFYWLRAARYRALTSRSASLAPIVGAAA